MTTWGLRRSLSGFLPDLHTRIPPTKHVPEVTIEHVRLYLQVVLRALSPSCWARDEPRCGCNPMPSLEGEPGEAQVDTYAARYIMLRIQNGPVPELQQPACPLETRGMDWLMDTERASGLSTKRRNPP
jgi:hypothetical protein